MGMVKSGLNTFLIFLVIIMLCGIIGVSLYFQHTIKVANQNYNAKVDVLENTKLALQDEMNRANNLNSSYENLSENMQSYTIEFQTVYSNCNNEKNRLVQELNKTKEELNLKTESLVSAKSDSNYISTQVSPMQTNDASLRGNIDKMVLLSGKIYEDADDNYNRNMTSSQCRSVLSGIRAEARDMKEESDSAKVSSDSIAGYISNIDKRIDSMVAYLRKY